jgi:hypothetical protein
VNGGLLRVHVADQRLARATIGLAVERLVDQQAQRRRGGLVPARPDPRRGANGHRRRSERRDAVDLRVGQDVAALGAEPLARLAQRGEDALEIGVVGNLDRDDRHAVVLGDS